MNDLTLLYLSANLIPETTQHKVIEHLATITHDYAYPVVLVTQKPVKSTFNQFMEIRALNQGSSPYNYYKQVLQGCYQARTEFVATCEDDTLYNAEHFTKRPRKDFNYAYNTNTWLGSNKVFWRSHNMNSFGFYISRREALIKLLEHRFEVWPHSLSLYEERHFHEPGVFEHDLPTKTGHFSTSVPIIAFEHRGTLSGKRKRFGNPGVPELKDYGSAKKLYQSYWF